MLLLATLVGGWSVYTIRQLDQIVAEKLSGRPWQIPSKIYSSSVVLYPDRQVSVEGLLDRLSRLDYRRITGEVRDPGEYRWNAKDGILDVYLHEFAYPGRTAESVPVRILFEDNTVVATRRLDTDRAIDSVEIEPEAVAGIFDEIWEDRRIIQMTEVPAILVHAVLAAEDRRFFEHVGIDVLGILRAFAANVRSGEIVQGGSTLTQQLVKNFFLTPARTIRRKVTEAAMAVLLERRYSKLEILELYLNEIYLGQRGPRGIYGVWEGSRFYFGKEPKDLSVAEAALLAGLIKAPSRYGPHRNAELARARRNDVLRALLQEGRITPAEYEQAVAEPLPKHPQKVEPVDMPYFVDFVRQELEGKFARDDLTSQGFRIFTTIDVSLQRAAEEAVARGVERLEERFPRLRSAKKDGTRIQAALVAIEPRSGEIRALVGGRSYQESQFNRVTQARRQPGSVFKPIVYLTAFQLEEEQRSGDYRPTRKIEDAPFVWRYDRGRQTWSPENYADEYHGTVTLRSALEHSLNAATSRLAHEIGVDRIADLATRLGFPKDLPRVPSLVLGSVEVTPLEVAEAFGAIANLGFRTEAASIRTVLAEDGVPLERTSLRTSRAVSPRVASLVTDLMQGVIERGTGRGVRRLGFDAPAAGKTGTTNDGRDAWFAGFTPELLTVVWVGYDQGKPLGLTGAQAALPIWTDFMKSAVVGTDETFLEPPGLETVPVDPLSAKPATEKCPLTYEEKFFTGDVPEETCPLHPVDPTAEAPGSTEFGDVPLLEPEKTPFPVPTPVVP